MPAPEMPSAADWKEIRKTYPQVIPKEVLTARSHARKIVSAAREEGAKLLAKARHDAQEIRLSARRTGRIAGYQCVTRLFLRYTAMRRNILEESRQDMIDLVLTASSILLRREVRTDQDWIRRLIEEILSGYRVKDPLELHIHKDGFESAELILAELRREHPELRGSEIVIDSSLAPGDCMVCSPVGEFVTTLDSQLEVLHETLANPKPECGSLQ